jgi:hypothetical protein
LVREHVEEQQDLAVGDDRGQNVVHVRGSCIIHRAPGCAAPQRSVRTPATTRHHIMRACRRRGRPILTAILTERDDAAPKGAVEASGCPEARECMSDTAVPPPDPTGE